MFKYYLPTTSSCFILHSSLKVTHLYVHSCISVLSVGSITVVSFIIRSYLEGSPTLFIAFKVANAIV